MSVPVLAAPAWPACLQAVAPDVCELRLQAVPQASRTEVAGLHGDALRLRVMAPAVDGRANVALLAWLADQLGQPRRAVTLLSGDTQRRKRIRIELPCERVAVWLAPLLDRKG